MLNNQIFKTILLLILLIVTIIGLSIFSNQVWGGKPESIAIPEHLIIKPEMTVQEFGKINNLTNPVLKEIFKLKSQSDLTINLSEYGNADTIQSLVIKNIALAAEEASKNWIKIVIKFILWACFLVSVYIYFRKHTMTIRLRKYLLFISLSIFGIMLGSDPSPMGTVKDAIYLFGSAHAVFPPRIIALIGFLIMVFLANKYICSWGCQIGTLQDLIFRFNVNKNNKAIIGKQIKLPFIITNSIRIIVFILFTLIVFLRGTDIIASIDIFKIYNPIHLGFIGIVSILIFLVMSLFIYRPWCHLVCPFGLIGWLMEKFSLVKINVNYNTCIACKKCTTSCPSTVMSAILYQNKKTIPDCFSCYTCREVCPTNSIRFTHDKRQKPPTDFFNKI